MGFGSVTGFISLLQYSVQFTISGTTTTHYSSHFTSSHLWLNLELIFQTNGILEPGPMPLRLLRLLDHTVSLKPISCLSIFKVSSLTSLRPGCENTFCPYTKNPHIRGVRYQGNVGRCSTC
jgi:hypothetical protein